MFLQLKKGVFCTFLLKRAKNKKRKVKVMVQEQRIYPTIPLRIRDRTASTIQGRHLLILPLAAREQKSGARDMGRMAMGFFMAWAPTPWPHGMAMSCPSGRAPLSSSSSAAPPPTPYEQQPRSWTFYRHSRPDCLVLRIAFPSMDCSPRSAHSNEPLLALFHAL